MKTIEALQYAVYGAEILSALTGFLYWRKIKESHWKWFPVYLLVIALAEISNYVALNEFKYNFLQKVIFRWIIVPFEFLFFTWLFSKTVNNKTGRMICYAGYFLILASLLADALFFSRSGKWAFFSFSYTIANFALLPLIILYIIQFAQSDEILKWQSSMMFWVVVGLAFFYLGTFPFFGLFNTLLNKHYNLFYTYAIVMLVLNVLMYSFFIVSFICGKPKK